MSTLSNTTPNPKSPPSKKEIVQMMEDFDISGTVTVREFCEIHDIDANTFRTWHGIYEGRHLESEKPGFVPLEIQLPNKERPGVPILFAEVGGIRLYREVSAEYLKSLLP